MPLLIIKNKKIKKPQERGLVLLVICGSVWFLLNGFHGLCVARLWSCGGELFLASGFLVRNLGVHGAGEERKKENLKKKEVKRKTKRNDQEKKEKKLN